MLFPSAADPVAIDSAQASYTLLAGALATLVVFGFVVARRLSDGAAVWAWGGVTFVLSQAARLPVLTLINALVIGAVAPTPGSGSWFTAVLIASFSAGIFEEGSRAFILSKAARYVRSERGGVAFGLGHAGIEALIFTLVPSVAALLLLGSVADGSAFENLPPESLAQLETAITFLGGQDVATSLLAFTERLFATLLHIVLSLYVVRAVVQSSDRGSLVRALVFPILLHGTANLATVLLLPAVGIVAAELVFAGITVAAAIHYLRTRPKASAPLT
ncbi:MAG: YhfC family glutamic-type intramembrane protease [Candidatus Limnocylindrus sp.]